MPRTIWEIGIKVGIGKLVLSTPYRQWMLKAVSDLGITILPITVEYCHMQSGLPKHHGDPFDRLIIAQAIVEQVSIVTGDAGFDVYSVTRIW